MKKKKKSESGQAIVEFLIVSTIILTLIFTVVQVSWGIAFAHYVHYATFMASRAYLASGATKQDQIDSATSVLKTMLKRGDKDLLGMIAKSRIGGERDINGAEPVKGAFIGTHPYAEGKETSRYYSWAEGVQFNFSVNPFLLPLAGWIKKEGMGKSIQPGTNQSPTKKIEYKGAIPYTSDSFLGREPSYDECFKEMHRLSTGIGIGRGDNADFIEDNGC